MDRVNWCRATGSGRSPIINGRRQPSLGGTSRMMREYHVRIFRVAMEKDAPFSEFEGTFNCVGPEPRVGDKVACVFSENIFGRHAEPWEPREIKKLTAVNRERVLEGLRKAWRV